MFGFCSEREEEEQDKWLEYGWFSSCVINPLYSCDLLISYLESCWQLLSAPHEADITVFFANTLHDCYIRIETDIGAATAKRPLPTS